MKTLAGALICAFTLAAAAPAFAGYYDLPAPPPAAEGPPPCDHGCPPPPPHCPCTPHMGAPRMGIPPGEQFRSDERFQRGDEHDRSDQRYERHEDSWTEEGPPPVHDDHVIVPSEFFEGESSVGPAFIEDYAGGGGGGFAESAAFGGASAFASASASASAHVDISVRIREMQHHMMMHQHQMMPHRSYGCGCSRRH
jgi:hypothetical protein